jgi:hypothetical protein
MNLSYLTDQVLLQDTKILVLRERECTLKILFHLAEIDRRKLFSDLKYGSLYEYCIKELKYSEWSAHQRIVAARLVNQIPEIVPKIASGALTLTNIGLAVKFMRDNKIEETSDKYKIIEKIENLSKKQCEDILFEITGRQRPQVTTITIMNETFSMLQRTREMLGGYLNNDDLLQKMAEDEIRKIEKERYKQTTPKGSPLPGEVTAVIPAQTKRDKYAESPKCEKCGSTTNLQYDHREQKVHGGGNEPENIRILCFNCNQRSRIEAGF